MSTATAIMASVPIYGWAAAAAMQVFNLLADDFMGEPGPPRFSCEVSLSLDADGHAQYAYDDGGDGVLRSAGESLGGALTGLVDSLADSGVRVDYGGIPSLRVLAEAGDPELYLQINSTARFGEDRAAAWS